MPHSMIPLKIFSSTFLDIYRKLIGETYNKKGELTFSDIIAIVRRSIWSNKYFSKSENQLDLDKCSEEKINSLIYQLTLAS